MFKKSVFSLVLLSLILASFIISAQQVVQVPVQEPAKTTHWYSFLSSAWFWGAFIIGVFVLLLAVGIFFLIKWLLQFWKSQSDIFYMLIKERKQLAKVHRRYNSTHWWKVHKNTPIRLVRQIGNQVKISQPIGYHRGDYVSHEGNVIISMNLRDKKKWFFIPITDVLVIPDKEKIDIEDIESKKKITIDNLPRASKIVQFNENEILLYAEGVSNTGEFYIPVLKSKDGKIIDLSLPVYQTLKEVVLGNYLFTQTSNFVDIAKKSIDMNPNLRYTTKAGDSSQSVEVSEDKS